MRGELLEKRGGIVMVLVFAKCTECKFIRHGELKLNILKGKSGEAIVKHAFVKGHIIQIGQNKYIAINEDELVACEKEEEENGK